MWFTVLRRYTLDVAVPVTLMFRDRLVGVLGASSSCLGGAREWVGEGAFDEEGEDRENVCEAGAGTGEWEPFSSAESLDKRYLEGS